MRFVTTLAVACIGLVLGCERSPDVPAHGAPEPPQLGAKQDEAKPAPNPSRVSTEHTPQRMVDDALAAVSPAIAPPAPRPRIGGSIPRPTIHARRPLPDDFDDTSLGVPTSDEPTAYIAWLKALSPSARRRIDATCRAHPTAYLLACGGIGPLHVPLPPRISARVPRDGEVRRKSRFENLEAWYRALTGEQRSYVQRHCPGGDDQPSSDLCGENTPLVVVFHGESVVFTGDATAGTFAFTPGAPTATDWPTAATPWLALDRNGNGIIDSGAELFGNHTSVGNGFTAVNGFAALRVLDTNGDGRLDVRDAAFDRLLLWSDRDANRRSAPDELRAASATIVSISLDDRVEPRCDARHNCEGERATLVWRDADGAPHRGAIVDVYLPNR